MGRKLGEEIEEVVDRKATERMEEHREIDKRKSNLVTVNFKESSKADFEMMEEHREIDKRKSNLITVNLKESTNADFEERKQEDLQVVHGLLGIHGLLGGIIELCDDDIENLIRLGVAGGNRPRMLRISMKSEQKKKMVLQKHLS